MIERSGSSSRYESSWPTDGKVSRPVGETAWELGWPELAGGLRPTGNDRFRRAAGCSPSTSPAVTLSGRRRGSVGLSGVVGRWGAGALVAVRSAHVLA